MPPTKEHFRARAAQPVEKRLESMKRALLDSRNRLREQEKRTHDAEVKSKELERQNQHLQVANERLQQMLHSHELQVRSEQLFGIVFLLSFEFQEGSSSNQAPYPDVPDDAQPSLSQYDTAKLPPRVSNVFIEGLRDTDKPDHMKYINIVNTSPGSNEQRRFMSQHSGAIIVCTDQREDAGHVIEYVKSTFGVGYVDMVCFLIDRRAMYAHHEVGAVEFVDFTERFIKLAREGMNDLAERYRIQKDLISRVHGEGATPSGFWS